MEDRIVPATFTWTGAADGDWNNGANWLGNVAPSGNAASPDNLVFSATTGTKATNNNITPASGLPTFQSITISASDYQLAGNAIALASLGTVIVNAGAANSVLAFDVASPSDLLRVTVNAGAELTISGKLSGIPGATLSKEGTGTLILGGDNSAFQGPINLASSAGILRITSANALGDAVAGTTVQVGSQLQIAIPTGATLNENLALSGFGILNDGALLNTSGANTWAGAITLGSDASIGAGASFAVSGLVSDGSGSPRNVTKAGPGTLSFTRVGGNTYRGTTSINAGALAITDPLSLGTGDGTAATGTFVAGGATLQLSPAAGQGLTVLDELLTINAGTVAATGADFRWTGPVQLTDAPTNGPATFFISPNSRLSLTGIVSDAAGASANGADLVVLGGGDLTLAGANTYRGFTAVVEGTLTIQNSQALGGSTRGTEVYNGASLQLAGNITVAGEALTVTGNGAVTANAVTPQWYASAGNFLVDPQNPNIVYEVNSSGVGLRKSTDGGGTFTTIIVPPVAPNSLVLDSINPSRLLVSVPNVGTFESLNRGTNFTSVAAPFTSIAIATFQGTFALDNRFPNVTDKGANTYDPDTIYGIAPGFGVFVTKDHGRSFVPALNIPTITDLQVDPSNRDTVYAATSGGQVVKSTDAGRSWTQIDQLGATKLPTNVGPINKMLIDPRTGNLYLGTDTGVFQRDAATGAWSRLGAGLDNVSIFGLALDPTDGPNFHTLLAGTQPFGGTVYRLNLAAAQTTGTPVVGAVVALDGASAWTGSVTLNGDPTTNTVTLAAAGNPANLNASASVNFVGPISDSGTPTIIKRGQGDVIFSNANTFAGALQIAEGGLGATNAAALGLTTAGTTVASGAALKLFSNLNAEPLTLNGDGVNGTGALRNVANNNAVASPITLATNTSLGADTGSNLNLNAIIGDANQNRTLTKVGSGLLSLRAANTYTGVTTVNAGTLSLFNITGQALNGALTVAPTGFVQLIAQNQILDTATVTVTGDGSLVNPGINFVGGSETIGSLVVTDRLVYVGSLVTANSVTMTGGKIDLAGNLTVKGSLTATSDSTGPATISGLGYLVATTLGGQTWTINDGPQAVDLDITAPLVNLNSLSKTGPGLLRLAGSNVNIGAESLIQIDQGELRLDGRLKHPINVENGTILSGIGSTTGAVQTNLTNATISPGNAGIGTLTVGSMTFAGGTSRFAVSLTHPNSAATPVPGTDNDLLIVNGNVNLNNAILALTVDPSVQPGDSFLIIRTTGTITGRFQETDGISVIYVGNIRFNVDYYSDGVALTRVTSWPLVAVPAPGSFQFASVDPTTDYVRDLYRTLLGRDADPIGLNEFVRLLSAGAPRQNVINQIMNSEEYLTRQVQNMYRTILGRTGDSGGIATFVNAFAQGAPVQAVVAIMVTSVEYYGKYPGSATDNAAWVRGLYQTLLGRAPSQSEVDGWTTPPSQVTNQPFHSAVSYAGFSRDFVVQSFMRSAEYASGVVNQYYRVYLGRTQNPQTTEAGAYAFFISSLGDGTLTERTLAAVFLASNEFVGKPRP